MRARTLFVSVVILALLLSGCTVLSNFGVKVINPSSNIISEKRDVSGFTAIEFSTVGKVNVTTGDSESLNISGPDNLVPEISTSVNNGILVIKNKENFTISSISSKDILTFNIVVKSLTALTISGAGDVQVDTLSAPAMDLTMSGAGTVVMSQLTTDNLKVTLSGAGGLEISGNGDQATFNISGAGSIQAGDLKLNSANITISGLGGATLWVTTTLNGTISGAGSVSYYGSPKTTTNTTGLGQFKSLGSK